MNVYTSKLLTFKYIHQNVARMHEKIPIAWDVFLLFWRRNRDSNPSWGETPLSVFKTDPFSRLGIPPW